MKTKPTTSFLFIRTLPLEEHKSLDGPNFNEHAETEAKPIFVVEQLFKQNI